MFYLQSDCSTFKSTAELNELLIKLLLLVSEPFLFESVLLLFSIIIKIKKISKNIIKKIIKNFKITKKFFMNLPVELLSSL